MSCNCRRKGECPLGRRCNSWNVVYQTSISPMEHNNKGGRFIWVSPLGIGNKDCITTYILSPIRKLETKSLYLNVFGTFKIRVNPSNKVENRQSLTANSFNDRCNLCIDENSIINFKDYRLLFNERNELVFNVDIT